MSHTETSKAFERRKREGFFTKYIQNLVIDIGCGSSGSVSDECEKWDIELGNSDATFMDGVADNSFNTVYASHILEHLIDPVTAIRNWYRIAKPNGWVIIIVPHRDLYERKRCLPSLWNRDHKNFFLPLHDDPPHTLGLLDTAIKALGKFQFESLRVMSDGHEHRDPMLHPNGEYSIELIIRKDP
jgi:SAM-dependent methyltransferase